MQPNFSEDLLSCHSRLCDLENELRKERSSLIENYNVGIYYHSYYPMLEKYSTYVDQYVMALANFKKLLQVSIHQQNTNDTINGQENKTNASEPPIPMTDNNNNIQREFAVNPTINIIDNTINTSTNNSMNNMNNMNNMNDDMKQPIERRKPPIHIKSKPATHGPIQVQLNNKNKIKKQQPVPVSVPVPVRVPAPVRQKPRKKILVARHKYRHNDKDFQIFWKRNFQRPMYTLTTLKINKSFSGKEREVKKYLNEKGGFKTELIEQITPIYNKDRKVIDFWLIRYRASLSYIYGCIERIDECERKGIVVKQNNRSKNNRLNMKESNKLYVSNFDILDKNCHAQLTNIFTKFGELERDIFIGKDKKTRNPYGKVEFRHINDAIACMDAHNHFNTQIFFPMRKNNENTKNSNKRFLNRKLRIEYNIPRDQNMLKKNNKKNKNRNNNTRR